MNIIVISEKAEDRLLQEEEELQDPAHKTLEEMEGDSLTLDNLEMYYLDPTSFERSSTNTPVEIKANDGSLMMTGRVQIDGIVDSSEVDRLIEDGLLDIIVEFINQDYRLNINKETLITDRLYSGIVSFIVSAGYNRFSSSTTRKSIVAATNDKDSKARIQKVLNAFFKKFDIGEDISDFNINDANKEAHDLLEQVALNLSKAEKRQAKTKIKQELAKNNISLVYLEVS